MKTVSSENESKSSSSVQQRKLSGEGICIENFETNIIDADKSKGSSKKSNTKSRADRLTVCEEFSISKKGRRYFYKWDR